MSAANMRLMKMQKYVEWRQEQFEKQMQTTGSQKVGEHSLMIHNNITLTKSHYDFKMKDGTMYANFDQHNLESPKVLLNQ